MMRTQAVQCGDWRHSSQASDQSKDFYGCPQIWRHLAMKIISTPSIAPAQYQTVN